MKQYLKNFLKEFDYPGACAEHLLMCYDAISETMKKTDLLTYCHMLAKWYANDCEDTVENDYKARNATLARMYGVETLNDLSKEMYLGEVRPLTDVIRALACSNVPDDKIIAVLEVLGWGDIED